MADIAFNLSLCKIKAVPGFAITHAAWSYLLDTVRAEGIRNSGQEKSSFTKACLSPQGPSQLRAMLLGCFAADTGKGESTVFISLMRNRRPHVGVWDATSPVLLALTPWTNLWNSKWAVSCTCPRTVYQVTGA